MDKLQGFGIGFGLALAALIVIWLALGIVLTPYYLWKFWRGP